jgi:hypothetical protein
MYKIELNSPTMLQPSPPHSLWQFPLPVQTNSSRTSHYNRLISRPLPCTRSAHMREVAGSTPGLDFYILCEPICVSLCLFHCTLYKKLVFDHTLMRNSSVGFYCRKSYRLLQRHRKSTLSAISRLDVII